MFYLKVKADDGSHLHLRIHKPLPHTNMPAELHGVKEGQHEAHNVEYF